MNPYFKLVVIITMLGIITGCDNLQNKNKLDDTLYTSDIVHDFNSLLQGYSQNKIDGYYLEDSLIGKDSIMDKQFHFAALLYFKKKDIDSLYQTLPSIFWNKNIDTMIYVNSINIISSSENINERTKSNISAIMKVLERTQIELIKIKGDIEKLRPGTKNEKINCQNCKSTVSSNSIEKTNNVSDLYLEVEKQFMIVYREFACTLFAIELINVRKVASKNYTVRI